MDEVWLKFATVLDEPKQAPPGMTDLRENFDLTPEDEELLDAIWADEEVDEEDDDAAAD